MKRTCTVYIALCVMVSHLLNGVFLVGRYVLWLC